MCDYILWSAKKESITVVKPATDKHVLTGVRNYFTLEIKCYSNDTALFLWRLAHAF